jgi:putative phosphoesterase
VRIGVVSDIHGNVLGLDAALERMGAIDHLICVGDAFDEYRFSNDVVARLRERDAHYVLGNHEDVLLSPAGVRARERPGIEASLLAWTAERQHWLRLDVDGKSLLLFHSTPWEPYGEYVFPHSRLLARFGELDVDYAIYGHTHAQLAQRVGRTLVINPGSAGHARDARNGRRLSCCVLDTGSGEVAIVDFDDPQLAR